MKDLKQLIFANAAFALLAAGFLVLTLSLGALSTLDQPAFPEGAGASATRDIEKLRGANLALEKEVWGLANQLDEFRIVYVRCLAVFSACTLLGLVMNLIVLVRIRRHELGAPPDIENASRDAG